ncbi:AmpG family muropeptide MFS transporter [Sphingomonas sp. So64.6b]|uniref:AmpG family muropeptide MFS transporter n=1 Tax=Sphingomonas sp. So64.6b TaxID=2997354 RepID=UPI0016004A0E|nr:MFS transporter [Sphingomonas sp. So64.6b]QNA83574.1 AmpG family muropeptide MFS transporter [Sphingomonas sp. So64.6b]
MDGTTPSGTGSWLDGLRPYVEKGPIAAFTLGISSGFPIAMIGATLTSRLAQDGLDKKTITAFTLGFLVYNLKPLWAWMVDGVRLPILGRLGQRASWLIFAGLLVVAAVANLAFVDPTTNLSGTIIAALLVGFTGATFDIVIDAYRIEQLKPYQLGVGSGMAQYGYRIGNVAAASLALFLAARFGWSVAYLSCAAFVIPAILTGLWLGEPERHRDPAARRGLPEIIASIVGPFAEFFKRQGAVIILIFILIHKIGDTLANIVLRLMLNDLGFSNDEIAIYDVGVGFWTYLIGVFIGGVLYARLGLKRAVLISLALMAISNASFALLAATGHSNLGLAGTIGFENLASGIGSVSVIAYFSALCDLRYTAAQFALISAASSVVGRLLTATTAGALVEQLGYVQFYWMTTAIAFPGVFLFWWMSRSGIIDRSIGDAGTAGEGDATAGPAA